MRADEGIKREWPALTKNHPIQAAITLALAKRINQVDRLRKKRPYNTAVDRTMAKTEASDELAETMREIKELTTWLPEEETRNPLRMARLTVSGQLEYFWPVQDLYGPTKMEVIRDAESMLKRGYPVSVVRAVLTRSNPRRRGRRVSKRGLTIKVLEAKIAKRHLSWDELAIRYCDCGKDHKFQCRERIRKNVARLKRLIAKYRIVLPPPGNKSS